MMLDLYAFKNKHDGRLITGTDSRYSPKRQIMNEYHVPLLVPGYKLDLEIKLREISPKEYKAVMVTVEEVKHGHD